MMDIAQKIAAEHIRKTNPSMWDGSGKMPADFDSRIATYSIDELTEMDISFELDNGEWCHYCELREKETEELLQVMHGYGIDSPQNLADTIEEILRGK